MPPSAHPQHALPALLRPVALLMLASLLAACTPFQRETPGAAASSPGAAALLAAESRIGAPYRYGGAGPDAFDCSGLVAYAYLQAGIQLPRTSSQLYAIAHPVPRRDLRPGDLVFFRLAGREVSHVGIYAGNDQFIHAPQSGGNVRIASLDDEWFSARYAGAGRPY
jgi:cell wall-associated NlpC family hydrolase